MLRRKEVLRLQSLLNPYSFKRLLHLSHCSLVRGINSAHSTTEYLSNLREKQSVSDVHVLKSNENFYGIEGDEGVIVVEADSSVKAEDLKIQSREKKDVERIFPASFGTIRCDYENKVKYHGQFENEDGYLLNRKGRTSVLKLISVPSKSPENESISTEEIIKKYNNECVHSRSVGSENKEFENINSSQTFENASNTCINSFESELEDFKINATVKDENNPSKSFIDAYYFQDSLLKGEELCSSNVSSKKDDFHSKDGILSLHNNENDHSGSLTSDVKKESNFIEEQYFGTSVKSDAFEINYPNFNQSDSHSLHDSNVTKIFNNCTSDGAINLKEEFEISESLQENKNMYISKEPLDVLKSKTDNIEVGTLNQSFNVETTNDKFNYENNSEEEGKVDCISVDSLPTNKTELKAELQRSELSGIQSDKKVLNFKYALNKSLNKTLKSTSGNFNESSDSIHKKDARSHVKVDFTQKHEQPKELNENIKEEEMKTAYDFAKKLRSDKKLSHSVIQDGKIVIPKEYKRDSKGFRILENQVPDFTDCTNDEIVSLLRNSILYSDENIIVLNKPYNLVIHESETTKDRCLSSLLEDLARDLDPKNASPRLLTVHRLDKETTGCLLLAKTEIMAQTLKSYFAQRKIMKKYLIITSKVPEPLEGIIDIPISEGFIEKKSRMVLQPEIPSDIKYHNHCSKGKRAVTHYKVISATHNAALVEVRPETGIKHQIRVHFGFGLACPILGDHKYSHLTKLAPQKLQADILQKLYVRQSKVRYIPMHIHAQSLIVPEYFEKRNLFVSAPLPEHMKRNMKALKLVK